MGTKSRLKILSNLMEGELPSTELLARTGLTPTNLSRQLSELEREGCIRRRREGRQVHVAIVDESLMELCELVCGALMSRAQGLSNLLGP